MIPRCRSKSPASGLRCTLSQGHESYHQAFEKLLGRGGWEEDRRIEWPRGQPPQIENDEEDDEAVDARKGGKP